MPAAFASNAPSDPIALLAARLGLQEIPHEGALWAPVCRASESIAALAARTPTPRDAFSTILCLVTGEHFSALHRLASTELWHFQGGAPLQLLLLHPDGRSERIVLGPDVAAGHRLTCCVPPRVWQGARLLIPAADAYGLIGNTVIPGFDYADYEAGDRADLLARFPDAADEIRRLTRV